jgi:hypothetical protein
MFSRLIIISTKRMLLNGKSNLLITQEVFRFLHYIINWFECYRYKQFSIQYGSTDDFSRIPLCHLPPSFCAVLSTGKALPMNEI